MSRPVGSTKTRHTKPNSSLRSEYGIFGAHDIFMYDTISCNSLLLWAYISFLTNMYYKYRAPFSLSHNIDSRLS